MPAPLPENEATRLNAVRGYCVLDTPPEPVFDHLTRLGAALFQVPVVLISLLDEHRQFFKSVVGLNVTETARRSSLCAYAILGDGVFIVLDAREDERFGENELVTGFPFIRFYAGAPLINNDGLKLGSFCLISPEPRQEFGQDQQDLLTTLAALTVDALEQRLLPARLARAEEDVLRAHERFQLVTQATEDGIWDWNLLTGEFYSSARLRELAGAGAVEHTGTVEEWLARLHPQDAVLCRDNINRLCHSQEPGFSSEYRVRHVDGNWRWIQNRGIAVRAAGGRLAAWSALPPTSRH